MNTILIKGGHVIDPENQLNERINILISGGKVSWLGHEEPAADQVIDAAGKIVCPGFIDIHMHEDPVDDEGRIDLCIFRRMLLMGVTTAVGGNCGSNVYDPALYLDIVDRDGTPVNVALFAGHSSARRRAGATDKYASADEEQKRRIEQEIDQALAAGCVGVSFGLRYVPGTDRDEFFRAAARCSGMGKIIASHVRDDAEAIFAAVDEMADAASRYQLPLQISHIGSMAGFGQMERLLRHTDSLRDNGLDIMLDCYPYDAFSTEIGATTYDDGWQQRYHCGYDVLEFCSGPWKGKRADPGSFAWMRQNQPDALTVCYVMRPEDISLALCHPSVMLASDGILDHGQGHPRAAGTFPRLISQYVRKGKLDMAEAIRKMTAMPAKRLGLTQKGTLKPGADADVVIFDPDTISDQATFAEPGLPPLGISLVMVAGQTAMRDGIIINERLGHSVRT